MTGERETLGFAIGPCESEPFCYEFLKDLISRGLSGVQLVISDAHEGLKNAIQKDLMEESAFHAKCFGSCATRSPANGRLLYLDDIRPT